MVATTIAEGLIAATSGHECVATRFDEPSTIEAYLMFERALAEVQGALGVIPPEAAATLVAVCRLENVDREALREGAAHGHGARAAERHLPGFEQFEDAVVVRGAGAGPFVAHDFGWLGLEVAHTVTLRRVTPRANRGS